MSHSHENNIFNTDGLQTVNIRCNNPGVVGTGVTGTVAAGDKLKAHWKQWTHRPAVALVYMAKCPSAGCDSWDGAGKVWCRFRLSLVDGVVLIRLSHSQDLPPGSRIRYSERGCMLDQQ